VEENPEVQNLTREDVIQGWEEKVGNELRAMKLECKLCGGLLGPAQQQDHPNEMWREFRECLKCHHQWAKKYWRELYNFQIEKLNKETMGQ